MNAEKDVPLTAYDVTMVTVEKTVYRVHAATPADAQTEAVVGHGAVVTTEVLEYDITGTAEVDVSTAPPPTPGGTDG